MNTEKTTPLYFLDEESKELVQVDCLLPEPQALTPQQAEWKRIKAIKPPARRFIHISATIAWKPYISPEILPAEPEAATLMVRMLGTPSDKNAQFRLHEGVMQWMIPKVTPNGTDGVHRIGMNAMKRALRLAGADKATIRGAKKTVRAKAST